MSCTVMSWHLMRDVHSSIKTVGCFLPAGSVAPFYHIEPGNTENQRRGAKERKGEERRQGEKGKGAWRKRMREERRRKVV